MHNRMNRAKFKDLSFQGISILVLISSLAVLLVLVGDLVQRGFPSVDLDFISQYPSRFPERSGILSAWIGSVAVMIVTAFVAIPVGIAAGVYLEEYARKNWITTLIEINITNLAGVPSIVFGLMALGLFVYQFGMGQSILSAGLTLALLILPIIIVTTREAIRTVPSHIREASYALGSTRWQTIRNHILPYSTGGILTGVIIAVSRAIGETAPLVTIGALAYIAYLPDAPLDTAFPYLSFSWLRSSFTVMPIQIFNWVSRPETEFHANAAGAALLLVTLTIVLNSFAIVIRQYYRRRVSW